MFLVLHFAFCLSCILEDYYTFNIHVQGSCLLYFKLSVTVYEQLEASLSLHAHFTALYSSATGSSEPRTSIFKALVDNRWCLPDTKLRRCVSMTNSFVAVGRTVVQATSSSYAVPGVGPFAARLGLSEQKEKRQRRA